MYLHGIVHVLRAVGRIAVEVLAIFLIAKCLLNFAEPSDVVLNNVVYKWDGDVVRTEHLDAPSMVRGQKGIFTAEIDMQTYGRYPTIFRIIPSACIKQLWVNDHEVPQEHIQTCWPGRMVNLSGYIQHGHNHIVAIIEDAGAEAGLILEQTTKGSIFFMLAQWCVVLIVLCYGFFRIK